jgi:hypothetical protein
LAIRGQPTDWEPILSAIRGDVDPAIAEIHRARYAYEAAIRVLIAQIKWRDFEHLVDMILVRSGWVRISTFGKSQAGIDLAVENAAINERAYVQVKGAASQEQFDDYKRLFDAGRQSYSRMIFAVHSPRGQIKKPSDPAVHLWTREEIAKLVVSLGLGERVEKMCG